MIVKLVNDIRFSLLTERPCPDMIKLEVTILHLKTIHFVFCSTLQFVYFIKSRKKEENYASNMLLLLDQ